MLFKSKFKLTTILFLGLGLQQLSAQLDTLLYLNSDFEELDDRNLWTLSLPGEEPRAWEWTQDGGKDAYSPKKPMSGLWNALYQYTVFTGDNHATFVSPPLDLSRAKKPELTFGYGQVNAGGSDKIYLLFQAGSGADWDTIYRYTQATDELINDGWEKDLYNIDAVGSQYLCENFRIAFMGFSNSYGGMTIDSVVVREKDTIPKFVRSFVYEPIEHEVIPSGGKQVPISKVKVEIVGNSGPSDLKSIQFRLDEGLESFFSASGFKLFHTKESTFRNKSEGASTQVGANVSISGGVVTFSELTHELFLGDNYLWLTADFSSSVPHNSYFEFGVNANTLMINDTTLPTTTISDIAHGIVRESVFYDDFSADLGWTLEGDFERDVPQGLVSGGSQDPDHAYTGLNVLGTDLTNDGLYQNGITSASAYYAYSPVLNLKYYNNVELHLRKWLDIGLDTARMEISNDGGTSWIPIWISTIDEPFNPIFQWREHHFEDDKEGKIMARKESVQLRIGMINTLSPRMGINLDHISITGNILDTDVGISQIISPFNDCIGFNNDTVKIVVKNLAQSNTPNRIPVFYALWGTDSTVVRDTIESVIAVDDSVVFKFSQLANFPRGDIYDKFVVGVDLEGDEDATNDSLLKTLYIQDNLTPPALVDFDYKGGVWLASEGSDWKYLEPEGVIPPLPGSVYSWISSPYGEYDINDLTYLTSSCFDMTFENRYIVKFDYWLESELDHDGFAIEYSTDDGGSWDLINASVYGPSWGWYTSMVAGLGHEGLSGVTTGWTSAQDILPDLSIYPKVKFRVKWASDNNLTNGKGMAFDNFELFPAPNDVGVSAITNPDSACQFVNTDTVHVYVKNFGYNDLKTNDTIIVGVDFESDAAIIDTFMLASPLAAGDSILFKIPTSIDIDNPGTYSLSAYTLIEDDPYFYGTNNDTLTRTFTIWPNPVSGMVDSLYSREPDTLVITPNFEAGWTYLWYDGLTTQSHAVSESDIFYSVTITESAHSCQTEDSTYVQLLFNDIGIGSIVWPRNSCELLPNELVEVSVKNKGTDSIPGNSKFILYYEVNGDSIIKDTITISDALQSGDSIPHIFSKTYDFSGLGDYTIKASAYFGGDTVRTNDTVVNTIKVFGYTPISLGPDYSVKQLTDTLDAGPVFASYLWSTGDETQTTIIDTSGKYWVDVIDINGCAGVDTVDVFLKIRDIEADLLVNPFTSCDRSGPESMQFQIRNNGSDTILTSDIITVDYRLDGGSVNEETVVLSSDLLPGEQFIHSFATSEDVSAYTSYIFDLTARTVGDLRTSNDSLSVTIETHQTPTVDLGGDRTVNGYQLVLDAGAGTNYSYLWNDNSTYQTLTATTNGNYWVTVTDSVTGCYAGDTVLITFDITDYAIQSFAIEDNPCSESYRNVEVKVLNNGNNIRNNATINVGFFVEGDDPIVEDYTVEGVWLPLNEISINLTSPIDLTSRLGTTDITVYLDQVGDLNPGNDVLTRAVNVREAPTVPIDGDTINTTLPYTIDATSPGDDNFYQWGDNTTGPVYTASVYGEYTVYVRTSNGCETVAHVWIDVPSYINEAAMENLDISLYPNPARDILNINAELKTGEEFIIEMFDISNRIVFSEIHHGYGKYENKIDVNNMSQGVYFVRVRNKEIYFVKRIIVK